MRMQVVVTDGGLATTISVLGDGLKWSQTYRSWEKALDAALSLDLLSIDVYREALSLPPAFPYYGEADVMDRRLAAAGFTYLHDLAA